MLGTRSFSLVLRRLLDFVLQPFDGPPRILIHGMNYAPEFIGVGKYTTDLAVFLAARQRQVEVIAALPHYPGWTVRSAHPWRYQQGRERDVAITRCPLVARRGGRGVWRMLAPMSFAAAAAPVVIWRALRSRPDVVLCVEPTLFTAPAALLAARLVGARAVLHVQDLEIDAAFATRQMTQRHARRLAQAVERFLLRRFDAVITICDSMATRLRRRGVSLDKLHVLRNWVDPAVLMPTLAPGELRTRLGLPDGRRIILYAGNLGVKQGLGVLVEAARWMRDDPHLHVVVAGDGPLAGAMRAAAASLPNMTIIGLQPPQQLGDLLDMADVHVLPQDAAAGDLVFPSKLGALLASGKPIVVTASAGTEMAKWLKGAVTVVPPGDGRALAAAIRQDLKGDHAARIETARALVRELAASTILPAFEATLLPDKRSRSAGQADPQQRLPQGWVADADQLGFVRPG